MSPENDRGERIRENDHCPNCGYHLGQKAIGAAEILDEFGLGPSDYGTYLSSRVPLRIEDDGTIVYL